MKRVTVYKNGFDVGAKMVAVKNSWEDFLSIISQKFGIQAKRIFTEEGEEIHKLEVIRDDDTYYVSTGEAFKKPTPVNIKGDSELQNELSSSDELTASEFLDMMNKFSDEFDSYRRAHGHTIYREIVAKERDEALKGSKLEDTGVNLVSKDQAHLLDFGREYSEMKEAASPIIENSSEDEKVTPPKKTKVNTPHRPKQKISPRTNKKRSNDYQDENLGLLAAGCETWKDSLNQVLNKTSPKNGCGQFPAKKGEVTYLTACENKVIPLQSEGKKCVSTLQAVEKKKCPFSGLLMEIA